MASTSSSRIHHTYSVQGRMVRVCDTLSNFRLIQEAMADETFEEWERSYLLLLMLYADASKVMEAVGPDLESFVADTLWEAFGIDINHSHFDETPCMDWEVDHDRIVATSRMAYGLGYEELEALPYREASVLMGLAPHETPMGQALYYRLGKEPKRTKYNGEQLKAWRKAKDYYALGQKSTRTPEARMEKEAEAALSNFEALMRMAKR